MKNPFRWLRRHPRRGRAAPTSSKADTDLERYFTNCEQARTCFVEAIAEPRLVREMIVIRGDGGVGKTSLLRMLRLTCHREAIPVGLVGCEEASSAIELLRRLTVDLGRDGAPFGAFDASYRRYQELTNKAIIDARAAGILQGDAAEKLLTAVAKGAIDAAAGAVPFVGPILSAVGGEAADAVINLLRATLSKPDLDFFLDPTARLTDDFVADAVRVSREQRIVIMLDTVEAITTLREWLCSLVQQEYPDVLWLLAGRELPDWDADWPGWVGRARILELVELSDVDMRQLVRQYYGLFEGNEPDPAHVDAIVRFARGLPLAATTVVLLSVKYHVTDLTQMGSGAVADMADRVLSDVPPGLRPAFEAAAVLRYFNADSLGALLGAGDANQLYDELRRWPFTRPRSNGFGVHDSMRDVMCRALRQRSPDAYRSLNEAAKVHYTAVAKGGPASDRTSAALEALYHAVCADEERGIAQFRLTAESYVRYRLLGQLRGLLRDANTWVIADESGRGWVRYYNARLEAYTHGDAVSEAAYREIGGDESLDPRLRAYALCDLGAVLATLDRLADTDGERKATDVVSQSLALQPSLDSKLARNHITLARISDSKAAWADSARHLGDLRNYAESVHDDFGSVEADLLIVTVRGLEGDWSGCLAARQRSLDRIRELGTVPSLTMEGSYFTWPLVFAGQPREAQRSAEEAHRLAIKLEEKELLVAIIESIALALGMQELYEAAQERFTEAIDFFTDFQARASGGDAVRADRYIRATLSFRGLVRMHGGDLEGAEVDLGRALEIKKAVGDRIGLPELYAWRGQLSELRNDRPTAVANYEQVLALTDLNRKYFEALAWSGLGRLHDADSDGPHSEDLRRAEELATRYAYSDVLARVHLTRGHLAWDRSAAADRRTTVTEAYRLALTAALQYNRYLLDEMLGGRGARGALQASVIGACSEQAEDGRQVLAALREWWVATHVESEADARRREPGNGEPQVTVLQQLDAPSVAGSVSSRDASKLRSN